MAKYKMNIDDRCDAYLYVGLPDEDTVGLHDVEVVVEEGIKNWIDDSEVQWLICFGEDSTGNTWKVVPRSSVWSDSGSELVDFELFYPVPTPTVVYGDVDLIDD